MLNQDRVILMTKMASYEANEGKKNMTICNYFRGDYIGWQVIKSAIASTVAFIVVLGVYIMYSFEQLLTDIYNIDLVATGKKLLFWYVVVTVVYTGITYLYFAIRYKKAKDSIKRYFGNLKKLNSMLGKEGNEEEDS